MAFQKGKEKTGGRKKGVGNKTKEELRAKLNILLDTSLDRLEEDIKTLTPKERIDFVSKIACYVLPKMSSVDASIEVTETNESSLDLSKLTNEQLANLENILKVAENEKE